ncbi:glycosyltransferase [Terriglobus saanensis]|uniref:Glycosyltransferase, MGT family n=1 Tax=Terriglobus saanensis (strain ATCC BAA-1853 / DSM 23119 / SP1PR4) TaxID=401053 RepID=E8UZM8_TERSS|nr:nucleotide disphospho-sugar-binding domain-containing protein [Terriglobus saanensis]ADV84371.1 glycosyltransferase, MGT family [Terriglobus saanensis SP1PR4]
MAEILVAVTPVPGHVNPMLAVARHLSENGHSVTFLSGSVFREQVVAAGIRFVSLSGIANFNYKRMDEEFPERAAANEKPGPNALNIDCICTGINPIPDQHEAIQKILFEGRVDLIVTEVWFWGCFPMLLGPREARPPVISLGVIPLIVSSRDVSPFSGPGTGPEGLLRNQQETQDFYKMMQPATARFNEVLRSCGAPDLPEFFFDCAAHLPDRFLALTAEALEYPRNDLKKSIQFIGNLVPKASANAPLPAWWGSLDRTKPVVLVTQGTVANGDVSQLIEPAIEALANEEMTVIVAAGRPDLEVIRLPRGGKPKNTEIEHFLPFGKVLPKVDVFVTNGGFGSINMALSEGVPMVVAGDTEEKVFTSARVAWTETGINLKTGRPTSDQIRSAVLSVLAEGKYKRNAQRLQKEFARYDALRSISDAVNDVLSQKAG